MTIALTALLSAPAHAATYVFSGPDAMLEDGTTASIGFTLTQDEPVQDAAVVPFAASQSGLFGLLSSGGGAFDDLVFVAGDQGPVLEAFYPSGTFIQNGASAYDDGTGGIYTLVVSGVDAVAAPEPAGLAMMGAGLLALGGVQRRRGLTASRDTAS